MFAFQSIVKVCLRDTKHRHVNPEGCGVHFSLLITSRKLSLSFMALHERMGQVYAIIGDK